MLLLLVHHGRLLVQVLLVVQLRRIGHAAVKRAAGHGSRCRCVERLHMGQNSVSASGQAARMHVRVQVDV